MMTKKHRAKRFTRLLAAILLAAGIVNLRTIFAQTPEVRTAPEPVFEVLRVKHNDPTKHSTDPMVIGPGTFIAPAASVAGLIASTFDVQQFQVEGLPDSIASETFNIEARETDSLIKEIRKLGPTEKQREERLIFQAILKDRFHVKLEREVRDAPIYLLKVGAAGPKVAGALPPHLLPDGTPALRTLPSTNEHCPGVTLSGPIGRIAGELSRELGSRVIDRTGLTGDYNLLITSCADEDHPRAIMSAVHEQLGLEMESQQGQVEIFHVEDIEMPTEE